jgi:hypothetical protein
VKEADRNEDAISSSIQKVIVKLSADLGLVRRQNPTLMGTKGLEMTLRSQLWLFEKA